MAEKQLTAEPQAYQDLLTSFSQNSSAAPPMGIEEHVALKVT